MLSSVNSPYLVGVYLQLPSILYVSRFTAGDVSCGSRLRVVSAGETRRRDSIKLPILLRCSGVKLAISSVP